MFLDWFTVTFSSCFQLISFDFGTSKNQAHLKRIHARNPSIPCHLNRAHQRDINIAPDKQALSVKGIKVVQLEWLLDSIQAKKRCKEASYLFSPLKNPSAPISDSPSTNQLQDKDQSNPSGTKRLLGANSDDEAPKASLAGKPPKKKQKDPQKASFMTLRVQVDEGFPSPRMPDRHQYCLGS
jgi:hypothetical protein